MNKLPPSALGAQSLWGATGRYGTHLRVSPLRRRNLGIFCQYLVIMHQQLPLGQTCRHLQGKASACLGRVRGQGMRARHLQQKVSDMHTVFTPHTGDIRRGTAGESAGSGLRQTPHHILIFKMGLAVLPDS